MLGIPAALRFYIALVISCLGVSHAEAQSKMEKCAAIAGPMLQTSDALSQLSTVISSLDFNQVSAEFDGEEAAAFKGLEIAKGELMPKLNQFLSQLEDGAILMRKCSR